MMLLRFWSLSLLLHLSNALSSASFGRSDLKPAGSRALFDDRGALAPPFPNGLCGGRLVEIDPRDTFGVHPRRNDWLLPPRTVHVWLPPGYTPMKRYRTIYVFDGQNAIDDKHSWTGHSWRLAGALTRLHDHDQINELPIVVLVPSADDELLLVKRRHLEYGDLSLPTAEAHADFIGSTLKPAVDSLFSTYSSAPDTMLLGSSLGGQASMNILLKHANRFGGAACMSPAFGLTLFRAISDPKAVANLKGKRLYFDMGGDGDEIKVQWVDIMDHMTSENWWNPGYFWLDTSLQGPLRQVLRRLQVAGIDYRYDHVPGARHNERAWAQRIDRPLVHLLGE